MNGDKDIKTYEQKSSEEKHRNLYEKQIELLNTFLEHGAISQLQYDKSLRDLTEKMGYQQLKSNK